jgi:PIN domain nuclease of toxin-antitoxin system
MIVLDTHIWVWWVDNNSQLTAQYQNWIERYKTEGLGISVISCWEVAKLVENGRIKLQCSVEEWIEQALGYPGVQLLQLTPRIAIESTQLPGIFHRDPADQIIVATARVWGCPLLTADERILKYPHVMLLQ